MRILLCNYRYFLSGGPERYLFSVKRLLESNGHEVIPFSVDYALNEPTPFSRYFVSAPVDRQSVYYKDMALTTASRIKLFVRASYSLESKRKIRELIKAEKPDIAYVLHIANSLSPSIIDGCSNLGIPVVMRLSDFNLICPAYRFLRNHEICTECESGYYRALSHKCLKNSWPVTAARVLSMYVHNLLKVYDRVETFVTPSAFLGNKMIGAGFPSSRVTHIPSFIATDEFEPSYSHRNYILYFGRIELDKGVEYLIRAFESVRKVRQDLRLLIAGGSSDGEKERLEARVAAERLSGIEFVGFKSRGELEPIVRNSALVVVPSIWYDNTPLTIYESFAYGKPVIGSNLGGIAEQIDHGVDGLLFDPKNAGDLAEKILCLVNNPDVLAKMGEMGRAKVEREYSADLHYERLIAVFLRALQQRSLAA